MKTLSLLVVTLSLTLGMQLTAQNEEAYQKAMVTAIDQFDQVKDAASLQVCKNSFERIATSYPERWLPVYYAAYLNTELVYWEMKSEQNNQRLEAAEKYLQQLEELKDADRSEVANLWGYFTMCRISLNPQTLGQELYQPTVTKFEEAMRLNPANPRPVILLAFFEQNLPPFLQSARNKAEEKKKAEELFNQEQVRDTVPYGGKDFRQMIAGAENQ